MQRETFMTANQRSESDNTVGTSDRTDGESRPGFFRRHRIPLFLGLVALCLYAGSIAYIIWVRVPTG